ncbi:hypothetical protein KTAU_22830 [Thermogemmatispora aurantia]|uniref:Uncharacterized protein n=1 Tax=Thermogemmatispora aurantia TaxID=2045279 RepID=A0A5J4KC38_9CHLR|nr:hypothetical protein KTAU_22830 [Thermogemmatispora aurantia]
MRETGQATGGSAWHHRIASPSLSGRSWDKRKAEGMLPALPCLAQGHFAQVRSALLSDCVGGAQ